MLEKRTKIPKIILEKRTKCQKIYWKNGQMCIFAVDIITE